MITLLWRHHILNNINIFISSILLTLLGLILVNDATFWSFIYLFIINLIVKKCINIIAAFFGSSFTICELTIVFQASFTFLAQSSICFLTGLGLVNVPASCSAHEEVRVLQVYLIKTIDISKSLLYSFDYIFLDTLLWFVLDLYNCD